ncbi:TPA: hypothetical protein ACH3X1_011064 [Trebouxia sp. C0004]
MAALHSLPSLTFCHQHSKLLQHTKAFFPPLLGHPRCIRLAGLNVNQFLAADRGSLIATARAETSDHSTDIGPSAYDRLLAASLYLWPICEGSWRLAVVFARIVQYHALNWLVWINMHSAEVTASNDQAAFRAITQACLTLYQEAAAFLKELLHLGTDDPSFLVQSGNIQSLRPLAGHYDSFCSLIYMAAVSSLASAAYTQQGQQQQSRRQQKEAHGPGKQRRWSQFRMPELVMGASTCALLLRLSLVSMQGASGLATDTYQFVAVSLTLASVCTGLAQIMQVMFGRFERDGKGVLLLMQQASNIAWLHCALSLSDWALMLSLPYSGSSKFHVGVTAAVTFALVQTLRHTVLNTNWLSRQ